MPGSAADASSLSAKHGSLLAGAIRYIAALSIGTLRLSVSGESRHKLHCNK